jgi:Mg/Co/Ni transporter MgtE
VLRAFGLLCSPFIAANVAVDDVEAEHVDAIAIAASLFIIVVASVGIGTVLPLIFFFCGFDPAHAGR